MALQWTPLRRRGGAVVRARQDVETLEHQTQANVLLAFKLSMVSGNNVNTLNSLPRLNRAHRKMADIGVQCDPLDSDLFDVPPSINSTVAEINTSSDNAELDTTASLSNQPSFHRPLSVESSGSLSSGEERSQRQMTREDLDVDAIFVQQSSAEEEVDIALETSLSAERPTEIVTPEEFKRDEVEESNCGLDCLSFTMKCCECIII